MMVAKEACEIREEQKEREKEEANQERKVMLEEIPRYVKCHKCPICTLCPHQQVSASGMIHHMVSTGTYWIAYSKSDNVDWRERLDLMKKATENCILLSRPERQERDQRSE